MTRAVLILGLVVAGCETPPSTVALYAITSAPPASKAAVVNESTTEHFEVDLSVGVALAVQCWDDCGDASGACTNAKLTSGDVNVLGIRPLYRVAGDQHEFVLVASGIGNTRLHVETDCATQDYEVAVFPRAP